MDIYDDIVVGGGPGGYVCAIQMAQNGLKTALIEKSALGGTCLNWGCIPTKALIYNASVLETVKNSEIFGFSFDVNSLAVDYGVAFSRSRKVVDQLRAGVESLIRKNQIDYFPDTAQFVDRNTIQTSRHGNLHGKNIVVATGSKAKIPPLFEPSDDRVLTARKALELNAIPRKAVIIGAGAMGVEFAYIWNAYGCEVTIVEILDSVLPAFDRQIGATIAQSLARQGIRIATGTKIEHVYQDASGMTLILANQSGQEKISTEVVLLAAGIIPCIENIGLDRIGVALEKGYIKVDSHMQTNIPGIYAIGDVTGILPLAHAASAQGQVAAACISGEPIEEINYDHMAKCVYSTPEAASIGLTEKQCVDRNIVVRIGRVSFGGNGKAAAMNSTAGFVKVITAVNSGVILGVHMVGPHVTELIAQCAPLMKLEITPDELLHVIFPHPSLSETFWEASNDSIGRMIHK